MVQATMQVFEAATTGFLPTPTKSHYIFNLRDFARVMRGVLLVPPARLPDNEKLIRLWVHEVFRVFNDRLTEDVDRSVRWPITDETSFWEYIGYLSTPLGVVII